MMSSHQGLHIGTLVKPHGVKGEMIIKGNPLVLEELHEGTPLFVEVDGQRVPFFIESVLPGGSGEKAILKLEFIDRIEETRRFITCEVYSDPAGAAGKESLPPISGYVGYMVADRGSKRTGRVTDYMDHPENPLLVLDVEGKEALLPVRADYILSIDEELRKIVVDLPEGLFPEDVE